MVIYTFIDKIFLDVSKMITSFNCKIIESESDVIYRTKGYL